MDKTRLPIQFEASRDFVQLTLSPEITQVPWNIVEECGDKAIAKLQECRATSLLVDLSSLEYLGSAQVALLARIWKVLSAQQGTMAVQTASPVVREVLKTAGLHRLWKLVDSHEQGLQKLGVNATGVHVVPARWTVGPGLTAIAGLLLSTLTWKGPADWRFWSGCGAILLGCLAVFLSRRAIVRAEQGQRALGMLSLLVGLGSVAAGAFFTWPRPDAEARIVDPERAAGVQVHDPAGFGETGPTPGEPQTLLPTDRQLPSDVSPTPGKPLPMDSAPGDAARGDAATGVPNRPQTSGDADPGSAPFRVNPATTTAPPIPPPQEPPDGKPAEPVSAPPRPETPADESPDRPEAPADPSEEPATPGTGPQNF